MTYQDENKILNKQNKSTHAIWFPAIRTGTGTDIFTIRLVQALSRRGIRSDITWLPHRAEYAPWSVPRPLPPPWANIVHINSWLPQRFVPKNLPLIVTSHGCVHDPLFDPYKNLIRKLYHRIWIRHCETENIARALAVTAVSYYTAEQTSRIFGRSGIEVIYNWIDTKIYTPSLRPHPHNPFRLLFVGKPSRRKGCDLLPLIMDRLGPEFELRYTGLPQDLGVKKLPSNIISIGHLKDESSLIEAYRNADALLFPSRLEGLSLVMLEAQTIGLPVIATNVSSLPEVVKHNQTGLLCPLDDTEAFAKAVCTLRESPNRWSEMCAQAAAHARDYFSERSAIDAWIDLYNRAIAADAEIRQKMDRRDE
jgi:glycosyltransferase involved in cell wall biosynthesis